MNNVQLIKEAARKAKTPTLHEKVDKLTTSMSKATKPASKPEPTFKPKKLSLIAGGSAGTGALVAKVKQLRMEGG